MASIDDTTISEQYLKPRARAGIRYDRGPLAYDGGLNFHLENASIEGGERNGVLTAIEDFIAGSNHHFDFKMIPALSGLGLLTTRARLEATTGLRDVIASIFSTTGLLQLINLVEEQLCLSMVRECDHQWNVLRLEAELDELKLRINSSSDKDPAD